MLDPGQALLYVCVLERQDRVASQRPFVIWVQVQAGADGMRCDATRKQCTVLYIYSYSYRHRHMQVFAGDDLQGSGQGQTGMAFFCQDACVVRGVWVTQSINHLLLRSMHDQLYLCMRDGRK